MKKHAFLPNRLFIFPAFCAAVLFTHCSRDMDSIDGPNLIDRFGPFAVVSELEISRDTVDFGAGETVAFNAQFNKSVDWVVSITGAESGAVKRIEGFSSLVNSENATWIGGTTDLPFFRIERCTVELTVTEEDAFINTGEVEIASTRVYPGLLLTDFEANPGTNIRVRNFQFEFNLAETGRLNSSVIPPAQGEFSLVLTGSDNAQDPFVGLVEVYSLLTGSTYLQLPSLVPQNIFFNCFLYSDGRPNAIAIIQLVIDSNNNGTFEDGTDATYQPADIVAVTWTGWKPYSLTLANFGIPEADMGRILLARVLLINDRVNNPIPPDEIQYGIDFITFTQGQPLTL